MDGFRCIIREGDEIKGAHLSDQEFINVLLGKPQGQGQGARTLRAEEEAEARFYAQAEGIEAPDDEETDEEADEADDEEADEGDDEADEDAAFYDEED